jgi:hypothetical protein
VQKLDDFMKSQGLDCAPEPCQPQGRRRPRRLHQPLQGSPAPQDPARPIHRPHRGKQAAIEQVLPKDDLRAFRGVYLETAQRLKEQQGKPGADGEPANPEVDQLDFEFVLFASAVIDYDYIMGLIAKFSGRTPGKSKMSREQLIGLIQRRCQVHGRARRHRRIHPHAQGRRRPQRNRHPRRLHPLQGGEERQGTRRHRRRGTASPPPPCKPSWTASSTA